MIFPFQGARILRFQPLNLPGCRITREAGWKFREASILFSSFFETMFFFSKKTIPSGNLTVRHRKNSPSKFLKKKKSHPKWWDFDFPANIYVSLPESHLDFFLPKKSDPPPDLASGELQVCCLKVRGGWKLDKANDPDIRQFLAGVIKWEAFFHQKLNGTLRYSGVGVRSLGPVGDFLEFWGGILKQYESMAFLRDFPPFVIMHCLGLVVYSDGLYSGPPFPKALILPPENT